MATEIELKVRITEIEAFETKLRTKAIFLKNYEKTDLYFQSSNRNSQPKSATAFRLRKDANRWFVTQKSKKIEQGIETNDELEFEVSDGEKFTRLMKSLNFEVVETKTKVGQAYRYRNVLIEFGTVSHLGHFAEIEWVFDHQASELETQEASQHLLEIVDELELSRTQIEPRPYSQLLKLFPKEST